MRTWRVVGFVCLAALLPATLYAQAASGIAGVVRDASGAVIPGVTVEAASPALIEKVRTVVTDAEGQDKIVDLRPGVYTVTFTLPGFNTIKRDGIELSAGLPLRSTPTCASARSRKRSPCPGRRRWSTPRTSSSSA